MRPLFRTVPVLLLGLFLGWSLHLHWQGDEATRNTGNSDMPMQAQGPASAGAAPADPVMQARGLLQSGDYRRTVELYTRLLELDDSSAAPAVRREILARASGSLASGDTRDARRLLVLYGDSVYRDVDAMVLLSDAEFALQAERTAIDRLYAARGDAWRQQDIELIDARIRDRVRSLSQRLQDSGDTAGQRRLFEHLVQLEPQHAPYFIELARAYRALGDAQAAQDALSLVAQDPQVGAQARAMIDEMSPGEETETGHTAAAVVALQRHGNHFVVEASAGGVSGLRLLIDTGATLTTLSSSTLARTGMRYRDSGRSAVFNTANGPVRAPVYIVERMIIGDWQVGDLEIGVLELDNIGGIDGLLGMNFLEHFRFFIDQEEPGLYLSLH